MALAQFDLIEIVMNMRAQGQETLNIFQYSIQSIPVTVTAVQLAEGWWNHVKATYRALQIVSQPDTFISVRVRELNDPAGDYAEFDVPTAEKLGTRANPAQQELLPSFNAAGVRLVVGTRTTRPGQKRFPFLTESDNNGGVLQAAYKALLTSHMNIMSVPMVLGAPAALTDLYPIVTKKDQFGVVSAYQFVTGYIINNNVTSQNSRKIGRGS